MKDEKFLLQLFSSEEEETEQGTEGEFEELIKGKFSAPFAKKVQGIIDRRFAKMKAVEEKNAELQSLVDKLSRENEPEEPDEVALAAEKTAEKAFREKLLSELTKESDELKGIYPEFSLENEIASSPDFSGLLLAGVPLRRAYEAVNLENILASAMMYAAKRAGKNAADAIKRGSRVQETAVLDNASALRHTDVNSLTDRDIMKILSEVSRGAKITF